jgi:uncharacterized protein YggE
MPWTRPAGDTVLTHRPSNVNDMSDTKSSSSTLTFIAVGLAGVSSLACALLLGRDRGSGSTDSPNVAPVPNSRTISVSGRAEQRIAPDRAKLVFVVTTTSRSASQAQLNNEKTAARVIAAIKTSGAESKEINPGGLSITTETRREQDPRVPILERSELIDVEYFVVSSQVTVMTGKLDSVGSMVRSAFDGGATTGSVEFSTTNMRKLADEARASAMKAAVAKAEAMTEIAGAKRGEVLTISLDDQMWSPLQVNGVDRRVFNASQNVDSVPGPPDSSGDMADLFGGGMISVTASVNASFEIVAK